MTDWSDSRIEFMKLALVFGLHLPALGFQYSMLSSAELKVSVIGAVQQIDKL